MRSPTHSTVCALSSASPCSKSNIMMRYLLPPFPLPIAIRAVEESRDVARDRIVERHERRGEARTPQILDLGLREILVAVAHLRRHVDIFDVGRAPERREHREHHGAEARGLPGADVEDAAHR